MGFSALASSRTTHTGSLQSLVSTGVNLTASVDTGTIDAATNWSGSITDGHAFAIVRAGVVIAVRCAKSVSTKRLTYFRLYLDDGSELETDVQVGDTIVIYEQPEVVAAGSALSAVAGITMTSYGSAQLQFREYNIGANAITTTGYIQFPSKHLLIFGPTAPPGLTLQAGAAGRIAIGWYRTQGGVSAFCADLIIRGTYTAASNFNVVDALVCTNSNSARVDWFGGVEESKAPSPANNDSLGTMIIYSKTCRTKGLDTGGAYQCRIQSSNFRTYGLTIENRSLALLALITLNGFKPINCDQAIAMSGGSPAGYTPVTGADLRGGNILDIGYRGDKKVRLINHKRGSAISPGGNTTTPDAQNRGVHEIRQETTVSLRNLAGASVDGARIFMRDTNNGNRLAAGVFTGSDDYTADRTYEGVTSSGSVSFTTSGGVLLADVYQNVANVAVTRFQDIVWDYRSRNNNSTDVFRFGYAAYGYLPATVDAALQGDVPCVVSAVPIVDSAVTESTQATVAAYTTLETLAKVYDYSCHWLTLSGANMETAGLGLQLLSYSGGVLDCGSLDVVIDATAASVFSVTAGTLTIKASSLSGTKIQTTGTITTANGATITALYEDTNGPSAKLVLTLPLANMYVCVHDGTGAEVECAVQTGVYTLLIPPGASGTWTWAVNKQAYVFAIGTFTPGSGGEFSISPACPQVFTTDGNPMYQGTASALVQVTFSGGFAYIDIGDGTPTLQAIYDACEDALYTDAGLDWIIDGGDGVSIFESSAGDFLFMTGGWRIRRWHAGDANATVPAFCQSVDGVVIDDANGSVQFQTSDNPTTIAAAVWAHLSALAVKAKTDNLPANPAAATDIPSAATIAAQTLAAAEATPIHSNAKTMNDAAIIGDGSELDPWRGVGVSP